MKWNETELLSHLATRSPDWEGQLSYKAPKSSSSFSMQQNQYKERYLKLYGNILIISKGPRDEQTSVLILESCNAQIEDKNIFAFSLNFQQTDLIEKHLFVAVNARSMNQWLEAFQNASLERMKERLINLQCQFKSRTGKDPLIGTNLEFNTSFDGCDLLDSTSGKELKSQSKSRHCECDHSSSSFTSHLGIEIGQDAAEKPCSECTQESGKPVGATKSSFKSHINEENLITF